MRLIVLFILIVLPHSLWASKVSPVSILEKNQGTVFNLSNYLTEGAQVYVYEKTPSNKYSIKAMLKVTGCDVDSCTAKVTKIKKNTVLTLNDYYSSKALVAPAKPAAKYTDLAFLTYGGPMAFGFNAGWLRDMSQEFKLGAVAGLIDSEIGNVGFSGKYAAVMAEYKLLEGDQLKLNPYGQVGYMMTTLDFGSVSGSEIDANVPMMGLGMNARYEMDALFGILRAGYSYNMYKASYSDDNGSYTTPAAGGLIVFELGVGMKF